MDGITDALASSFQVSNATNSIYSPHPRQNLHKVKTNRSADQDVRRQRYLDLQKKKRFDYSSHARRLALNQWSDDEECDKENPEDEKSDDVEMEVITHVKPPKRYKDQLMLSEWLIEIPSDFEENWRMVICPVGRRNLVVAAGGRTSNYSKSGYRIDSFSSNLPGGDKSSTTGYTVLDCIYCELAKTFYILDVMCWNKHPVYDCETDFRFFWLQSKMNEISDEKAKGPYKFQVLPNCRCGKPEIEKMLKNDLSNTTDGVLFYHSKAYYMFGATPLVLWLKPNMLHDMLGVTVPVIEGSDDVCFEEN